MILLASLEIKLLYPVRRALIQKSSATIAEQIWQVKAARLPISSQIKVLHRECGLNNLRIAQSGKGKLNG